MSLSFQADNHEQTLCTQNKLLLDDLNEQSDQGPQPDIEKTENYWFWTDLEFVRLVYFAKNVLLPV